MIEQATLFDLQPEGTEPPIAQRRITLGCLRPTPANQVIDTRRAGRILAIDECTVLKMLRLRLLCGYQLEGGNEPWQITYASVVDLCDRLRVDFAIKDRRPSARSGVRWRDEDLLPFPMNDTVTVQDVVTGLDISKRKALHLIESGRFESYRLMHGSNWRVSKTSLYHYAERLKMQLAAPVKAARARP